MRISTRGRVEFPDFRGAVASTAWKLCFHGVDSRDDRGSAAAVVLHGVESFFPQSGRPRRPGLPFSSGWKVSFHWLEKPGRFLHGVENFFPRRGQAPGRARTCAGSFQISGGDLSGFSRPWNLPGPIVQTVEKYFPQAGRIGGDSPRRGKLLSTAWTGARARAYVRTGARGRA